MEKNSLLILILVSLFILEGLLFSGTTSNIAQATTIYDLPADSFDVLIDRIANIFFTIVVIISVIFLLWGGITILTAAGNAEQVEKGRNILLYAVIGFAIALLARALQAFLINYMLQPGGGGGGGGGSSNIPGAPQMQ